MTNEDEELQALEWGALYGRAVEVLGRFGNENAFGKADFWVLDDNWGPRQQKVLINKLHMLHPSIIKSLQALLSEFPAWDIVVAVAIGDEGESWPEMGLIIRSHEIIDGLQRQYFPEEYRGLHYEGGRIGTDRD